MKGTRGQIIELLRQHGELTIQCLTEYLGLAPAAVRRHLDILAGEGTVQVRSVKQSTGRPYYEYRLSEQAQEQLSNDYPRFTERLIQEARALDGTVTSEGRHLLDALFERVSDRMVAEHRVQVQGGTFEARIDSLTVALRDEGILNTWTQQEDGYHLYNNACPHHRAARASSGLCCSSERRAIALLLDADVTQVGSIVDGGPMCEYFVKRTTTQA